jgi:two-component system phosphate regulon sensor histidine kinase PhoR
LKVLQKPDAACRGENRLGNERDEQNVNHFLWSLGGVLVGAIAVYIVLRKRPPLPSARGADLSAEEQADLSELARDRRRSSEIIERMIEGVLVLNEALTPILANASARSLLGLPKEPLPMRLPSEEVAAVARDALDADSGTEEIVRVWFPSRMALRVHAAPLEDRGVVVVLQDVTQELLAQRIRREFVASASHELKSPVASIQALGEALEHAAPTDPEKTVRFAAQIVTETQRMSRLISDLLDLSKLEETVEAPQQPSDLAEVARDVCAEIRDVAEDADIELVATITPGLVILGDDQQLTLMVRNLIDNAIRYTPPDGRVTLDVYRDAEEAVVEVADSGIGIPLEAQERVFERFYRVDRARSRDMGGTGLGLAIVKHVAELHRGTISLQSAPGEGTRFEIRIPAAKGSDRLRSAG